MLNVQSIAAYFTAAALLAGGHAPAFAQSGGVASPVLLTITPDLLVIDPGTSPAGRGTPIGATDRYCGLAVASEVSEDMAGHTLTRLIVLPRFQEVGSNYNHGYPANEDVLRQAVGRNPSVAAAIRDLQQIRQSLTDPRKTPAKKLTILQALPTADQPRCEPQARRITANAPDWA